MNNGEKPIIERSYHIPLPMFQDAFRAFQKKYVYPKNYILTVILVVIGAVYVESAIHDSSNTLAYLLIIVCMAMICILWYNPRKLRRSLFTSLKEIENDIYHIQLFRDGISIATEDAPAPEEVLVTTVDEAVSSEKIVNQDVDTSIQDNQQEQTDENGFHELFPEKESADCVEATTISFAQNVKIIEKKEYFMVYVVKHMFYVVPKDAFSDDELEQMRKIFREQLNA